MDSTRIHRRADGSDIAAGLARVEGTTVGITGGAFGGDEGWEKWQEQSKVGGKAEHP